MSLRGTFTVSVASADSRKVWQVHSSRRTKASASAKVKWSFRDQAGSGTVTRDRLRRCSASSVTKENRPSRAGVVRAMARSDHWRWVSRPRWRRASSKVTSSCQRWTNQARIWSGVARTSVHSSACVANLCVVWLHQHHHRFSHIVASPAVAGYTRGLEAVQRWEGATMEAEWSADRANLRLAVREHPEWSVPQLAQQIGRSLSWVKKWCQRLRFAPADDEAVLHSRSRARNHPPPSLSPAAIERILAI